MQSANYIVHDTHGNIVATGAYDRSDKTAVIKYNARFVEALEKGHFVTIGNAEADMRRVGIHVLRGHKPTLVVQDERVDEHFAARMEASRAFSKMEPAVGIAKGADLGADAAQEHEASLEALATLDAEKRQKELKRERDRRYRENRKAKRAEMEDA